MLAAIRRHPVVVVGLPACLLVFVADVAIREDAAIWLGYVAVISLAAWFGSRRSTFFLAALSTLLIVVGFFLSPHSRGPSITVADRAGGTVLMWGVAFLIDNRHQLFLRTTRQGEGLRTANEQLRQQAEQLNVHASELRGANESLQTMSAKLVEVQENERRAFARELHDESSQLLSAMIVRLGALQRSWTEGDLSVDGFEELKRMATQLAEGLHRLAMNLRPVSLDRAGLVAAVEQYVESYRETYGVQVDVVADNFGSDRLPTDLEGMLYRIIQEALTNVARHAQAGHIGVVLTRRPAAIAAIIEDDGIGFDVEEAARTSRLGLSGMKERAELLGGTLTIESRPGGGTTIFVEIPGPAHLPASAGAYQTEPS